MLAASAAFAAVVVGTSFPFTSLASQHHQLAATAAHVASVQAADRQLSAEAAHLGSQSTIAALARSNYGFVQPGQKVYTVLPPSGSPPGAAARSGYVPLDGPPVVPGSPESQALLGASGLAGDAGAGTSGSGSHRRSPPGTTSAGAAALSMTGHGFWGRVGRTLEFWR